MFCFDRFGYVFQHCESWHKIDGRHFGSRLLIGFSIFSISHPFVLTHPCVKLSGSSYLSYSFSLASEDGRSHSNAAHQYPGVHWPESSSSFTCYGTSLVCRSLALSNLPCWLIVDRFFQIHIAFVSGCVPIRWKRLNVPTTSCRGLHHTQSRLLASPLRSTCSALSSSLRKECWHFSLPTYWRRVTAQTQTGLDTSGSVVHFSMNFVDQMPTRRSSTGSKISIQSWSKLADWNFTCGEVFLCTFPLSKTKLWTYTTLNFLCNLVKSQDLSVCGIPWLRPSLRGGFLNSFRSASNSNVGVRFAYLNSSPPKQESRASGKAWGGRAFT